MKIIEEEIKKVYTSDVYDKTQLKSKPDRTQIATPKGHERVQKKQEKNVKEQEIKKKIDELMNEASKWITQYTEARANGYEDHNAMNKFQKITDEVKKLNSLVGHTDFPGVSKAEE